jgi:beta-barrel assembly-enhancing protease
MRPVLFAVVLFAVVSFSLLAQNITSPRDKEAALGATLAGGIESKTTPIASKLVQDYVDQLGQKIAVQLKEPFTFSFLAITDDLAAEIHEPLSLPSGHIFVSAALILAARNESEFAGMLAQAMSRRPPRIESLNATIPLIYTGVFGPAPQSALPAMRSAALEADQLAVETLARAGIDPEGLRDYIDREQRNDHRSALPDRATRLAAIERAIRNLPPAIYTESGDFPQVRQEARPAPPKPPSLK